MSTTEYNPTIVVDDPEDKLNWFWIGGLICFGIGALLIIAAFIRLGYWYFNQRKQKKYSKWWLRQMEHRRHLEEYSIRTGDARSLHSQLNHGSWASHLNDNEAFNHDEQVSPQSPNRRHVIGGQGRTNRKPTKGQGFIGSKDSGAQLINSQESGVQGFTDSTDTRIQSQGQRSRLQGESADYMGNNTTQVNPGTQNSVQFHETPNPEVIYTGSIRIKTSGTGMNGYSSDGLDYL